MKIAYELYFYVYFFSLGELIILNPLLVCPLWAIWLWIIFLCVSHEIIVLNSISFIKKLLFFHSPQSTTWENWFLLNIILLFRILFRIPFFFFFLFTVIRYSALFLTCLLRCLIWTWYKGGPFFLIKRILDHFFSS